MTHPVMIQEIIVMYMYVQYSAVLYTNVKQINSVVTHFGLVMYTGWFCLVLSCLLDMLGHLECCLLAVRPHASH